MPESQNRYEWLTQEFPEFGLLPDDQARHDVLRGLRRRLFGANPWLYLYAVGLGVLIFAGWPLIWPGFQWINQYLRLPGWAGYLILLVVFVIVYYTGIALFWRSAMHRYLRKELTKRGIQVCQKCGYDCRAVSEPRCPECGAALTSVSQPSS